MKITYDGIEIDIKVWGVSEVQNINGSKELHVSIGAALPTGPRGPGGEPLPKPLAA